MKKEKPSIKKKFYWHWYISAIPMIVGLLLVLLTLAKIIPDRIGEDGILIEEGFHTFALGCMLVVIGVVSIGAILIIKSLYFRFRRKA